LNVYAMLCHVAAASLFTHLLPSMPAFSRPKALCYHEITIGGHGHRGGETHQRELSQEQAQKGIEALIKAIYSALFEHLVKKINTAVAVDVPEDAADRKEKGARRSGRAMKAASIGILASGHRLLQPPGLFTLHDSLAHTCNHAFALPYTGYFWL
jgi:hypothetical protein